MGDEKDWQDWLDEYNQTMLASGTAADDVINIDLSDYAAAQTIDIGDITLGGEWTDYKDWIYQSHNTHNNITLTGGGEEMLRVAEDGFYVRGVRVEADAKEAEQVYKAFKQWLTWASLSKPDEE